MEKALFLILAAVCAVAALNVVLQRNPLYSALSLIATLCSLAAIFITLQAQFIAAIQVVVYAGAIMVLFVFVIMLLNVTTAERTIDRHRYLKFLAIPFAGLLITEVFYVITRFPQAQMPTGAIGTTESIGVYLFNQYLLPFEVTSILILMAMVGAMVLARREEKGK